MNNEDNRGYGKASASGRKSDCSTHRIAVVNCKSTNRNTDRRTDITIDTGVSEHAVSHTAFLTKIVDVPSITVELANATTNMAAVKAI